MVAYQTSAARSVALPSVPTSGQPNPKSTTHQHLEQPLATQVDYPRSIDYQNHTDVIHGRFDPLALFYIGLFQTLFHPWCVHVWHQLSIFRICPHCLGERSRVATAPRLVSSWSGDIHSLLLTICQTAWLVCLPPVIAFLTLSILILFCCSRRCSCLRCVSTSARRIKLPLPAYPLIIVECVPGGNIESWRGWTHHHSPVLLCHSLSIHSHSRLLPVMCVRKFFPQILNVWSPLLIRDMQCIISHGMVLITFSFGQVWCLHDVSQILLSSFEALEFELTACWVLDRCESERLFRCSICERCDLSGPDNCITACDNSYNDMLEWQHL